MSRGLVGALVLALLAAACEAPQQASTGLTGEAAGRDALGIPASARYVVVVNQSSHLHIDWLMTFEEYYRVTVRDVLYEGLAFSAAWPGVSHYSIAEMGFLRRFLSDLSSADQAQLRAHLASRQWSIVGGGISSPDEILPAGEALLRDWGHGNRWAEETLGARARSAWTPDSFGHSPYTPSILRLLGINAIGFSRIPGSPAYPNRELSALADQIVHDGHDLAGSVGERFRAEGTQAFRWRAPDGAEVLGMWMPWLYCQGDFIDRPLPLIPGYPAGPAYPLATVLDRLGVQLSELTAFAGTGYAFMPVGCDFQPPIQLLPEYVEAWNRERFAATGIYVIQDSFDTYADLVRYHWDELPVEETDFNPVFSGFYGMRPWIKEHHRRLTGRLQDIEAMRVLTGATERYADTEDLWWLIGKGNHHDWIPGTSRDRVYTQEQVAQFTEGFASAEALMDQAWSRAMAHLDYGVDDDAGETLLIFNGGATRPVAPLRWRQRFATPGTRSVALRIGGRMLPAHCRARESYANGTLASADCEALASDLPLPGFVAATVVPSSTPPETAPAIVWTNDLGAVVAPSMASHLSIAWHETQLLFSALQGWALVGWRHNDVEMLRPGGSASVALYDDNGGLYRIGGELPQCTFALDLTQAEFSASISATFDGRAPVAVVQLVSPRMTGSLRWTVLPDGALAVDMVADVPRSTSAIFGIDTRDAGNSVTMSVPYGVVERPRTHIFSPSFWPVSNWIDSGSIAALSEAFAGWRLSSEGRLETFVTRNASTQEECTMHGAAGTADGPGGGALVLIAHPGTNWKVADVALRGLSLSRPPVLRHAHPGAAASDPLPQIHVAGDYVPVALEPLGAQAALRLWSMTGSGRAEIDVGGSDADSAWSQASAQLAYLPTPDDAVTLSRKGRGLALSASRGLIQLVTPIESDGEPQ